MMELPSQVRKPMSTEEEHYLSEDSIQKKKKDIKLGLVLGVRE